MQKELEELQFGNYYIPFATHIAKKTVISKSGLISQTVFLPSSQDINISSNIVAALQAILTPDVFINIHAIHSENANSKPESFPHFLTKSYSHMVASHSQYTQGFYITISIYGHKIDMKNFGHFLLKQRFLMEIENASTKLETITHNFCKSIVQYGPHILSIRSKNDVLYSENASFLYNIFYGKPAQIPVADLEISDQIKPITINHAKNHIQLTRGKVTDFISILTIKEFPIAEKRKMAELFTINRQYIICQSLYQMENAQIRPFFTYQNKTISVIQKNSILQKTGIAHMLQTKQPICMQTNIIIHENTQEEVNISATKILQKLQSIGLAAIREDINTEQAFYACLPANPHFINRKEYTSTNYTSQFIASPNFLFQGIEKLKYINFFPIFDTEKKLFGISPFLKSGTRHILINGSHLQGKALLINTMLLHLHQSSRILCIDTNYSSFALIKTILGSCITSPSFNILNLLNHSQKSFYIVFTAATKLYCLNKNLQFTKELATEIELFTKNAKAETSLETLLTLSQNEVIKNTLQYLFENNLLAEKDCAQFHKNYLAINIGESYKETYQILCLHIMLSAIHTGQEGDIVKFDCTFEAFTESIISSQTILFLLKEAISKNISFILGNDLPPEFENQNIIKYGDVFNAIEFSIFTESNCSSQFVKKFFQVKSNVVKHLMFAKKGTNKAVINTPNYLFTTNFSNLLKNKPLSIFNPQDSNYIENIKIIDSYKNNKEELLELFLTKNA